MPNQGILYANNMNIPKMKRNKEGAYLSGRRKKRRKSGRRGKEEGREGAKEAGWWPKEEGCGGARGRQRWSKGEGEEKGEKGKKSGTSWVLPILPRDIVLSAHQLSVVVLGTSGAYQACTQAPPPSGPSAAVLGLELCQNTRNWEKRG